jgi:predicted nuclease of predicted toxin-antitoxin system
MCLEKSSMRCVEPDTIMTWMSELSPGAGDDEVLTMSVAERRILVTFDKDFGEMVFRRGRKATCGVILLRPRLQSPDSLCRFTVAALGQTLAWAGHFSVAHEGRLRMIPLPG